MSSDEIEQINARLTALEELVEKLVPKRMTVEDHRRYIPLIEKRRKEWLDDRSKELGIDLRKLPRYQL